MKRHLLQIFARWESRKKNSFPVICPSFDQDNVVCCFNFADKGCRTSMRTWEQKNHFIYEIMTCMRTYLLVNWTSRCSSTVMIDKTQDPAYLSFTSSSQKLVRVKWKASEGKKFLSYETFLVVLNTNNYEILSCVAVFGYFSILKWKLPVKGNKSWPMKAFLAAFFLPTLGSQCTDQIIRQLK